MTKAAAQKADAKAKKLEDAVSLAQTKEHDAAQKLTTAEQDVDENNRNTKKLKEQQQKLRDSRGQAFGDVGKAEANARDALQAAKAMEEVEKLDQAASNAGSDCIAP